MVAVSTKQIGDVAEKSAEGEGMVENVTAISPVQLPLFVAKI